MTGGVENQKRRALDRNSSFHRTKCRQATECRRIITSSPPKALQGKPLSRQEMKPPTGAPHEASNRFTGHRAAPGGGDGGFSQHLVRLASLHQLAFSPHARAACASINC